MSMKETVKSSVYNRMFDFLMKHRGEDVIRAVNTSASARKRERSVQKMF